ncbi:heme-binding protein [Burkholderia sp. Bp9015]|nr:heme-binding protein [Burkholderia sp. Bp9131]RQR68995.1 heme-binding protein [Burkholderia sp. Bp9015]RQS04264.1 heme-binding protein [Burkholderia sp. Bp8991]RQS29778.1 heme-binding protein [Burkholderia sp. Bp8995]RQS47874.1 heme-binding protein [Burkholderia sp. Bp8989]
MAWSQEMEVKFSRLRVRRWLTRAGVGAGCVVAMHAACAQEVRSDAATLTYALSYAQTQALLSLAIAEADARHLAMGFAVVDPGGHLLAAVRMDGASFSSIDFARGKAFASVALGGQSGVTLEHRYRDDPSEYSNMSGAGYYAPFLPGRGTFPVFMNGHLLGAIGAAGAPSEIDDQVVLKAIAGLGAQSAR